MASIEPAGTIRSQWGEGPIWCHGALYYVDLEGHRIHRYNPADGSESSRIFAQRIGTIVPRESGGFVVAGDLGLFFLDWETGHLTAIADPEPDKPDNRFNDGKCSPDGRFFAGTISLVKKTGDARLYRLDPDLSLHEAFGPVTNSNGIAWSVDGKRVFYIDTPRREVLAFDYDEGHLRNMRGVVDTSHIDASPDGMTIDETGKLWIAFCHGACVVCFDPENGEELRRIELPCLETTACAFGGPDLADLYVTTGVHKSVVEEHAGRLFVVKGLDVKRSRGKFVCRLKLQSIAFPFFERMPLSAAFSMSLPHFPNMKPKPIAIAGAAIFIALGGFLAGRASSPASSEKTAEGAIGSGSPRSSSGSGTGIGGDVSEKSTRAAKRAAGAVGTKSERLEKLEGIVRGENPLDRNRALMAFIDRLDPGDFAEAVANFRALGITEDRMNEYSLLLTAWAQVDPLAALDFAKENTRNGFARDTILTSWAGKDPEAAIRWAQSNHTGDEANPFLPGIIRGLAGIDPARATELLTSMPRSEERGRGLDFMLPHLLQQGAEPTREWIASIKDEALRDGAMMRSAQQLAAADPAGTVKWLLDNPGEAARRRMDDVYGTWASVDSKAALASFTTLPAGETRTDALRGVITGVTVEDPKAGLALLNRYPTDVNDNVVRDFLWHSFGSDPALAVSQISRITDPQNRDQTYRRALGEWMRRDSAAATAWIQANPGVPVQIQNELFGNPTP